MTRVTRDDILASLETAEFPPPDMIIRTGGHMRHSGYFLFQSPYAEYGFSPLNWPDFDADELDRMIESYESRERKFGK
jgi:undecaprenyl diphosphate synthase